MLETFYPAGNAVPEEFRGRSERQIGCRAQSVHGLLRGTILEDDRRQSVRNGPVFRRQADHASWSGFGGHHRFCGSLRRALHAPAHERLASTHRAKKNVGNRPGLEKKKKATGVNRPGCHFRVYTVESRERQSPDWRLASRLSGEWR